MNYLAVIYALFLPISWNARSAISIMILILFLIRRNYFFYIQQSFQNPIVKAFLLYFLMHFIWLIGSENLEHAKKMIGLAKYAIIPFLFLTFLTKDFGYKMITAFITGMFISEILSYLIRLEFLPVTLDLFEQIIYNAVGVLNPTPFLLHMHYTVSLSIVIAILTYKIFTLEYTFKIKLLSIFFIIISTINLSLVQGRSGYVTYIVLLISVVIIRFKKKAFFPLIIILLFLSTIGFLAYDNNKSFKNRIVQTSNSVISLTKNNMDFSSSIGTRIGLWYYSIEATTNNILLGLGTGDQMDEMQKLIPEEHKHLLNMHHLHNKYISIYSQFGIVGLLIFLNIFYQIFKYNKLDSNRKNIMILITIGIMFALITETFSSRYYLPLLATLISALITNNNFLEKEETFSVKKTYFIYLFIIILVFINNYMR